MVNRKDVLAAIVFVVILLVFCLAVDRVTEASDEAELSLVRDAVKNAALTAEGALRLMLERSYREIADSLGISEKTVSSRLSRGKAMLIEKLKEEGYDTP